MPAPARFTFDLDLGSRGDRGRMMTEGALLDMARAASAEGFARGFAEGEAGMVARKARDLTRAAERLAEKAAGMQAAFEEARRAAIAEAADLAFAVGRKLAGHLIERHPAAELQALVEECLASLEGVPHLVVRCHPEVAEAIRAAAEARMAIAGFEGRLVVIGDPDLGISDGRVEWADGGVARNVARTIAELDTTIAGFLDGRRPARLEENDR
jgi:flagellar assembly protein FliH